MLRRGSNFTWWENYSYSAAIAKFAWKKELICINYLMISTFNV